MKKLSKYAIVDYRTSEETIDNLKKYFCKVIFTKPVNTYEAICGHADISVCKISDNHIITCPSLYEYYKNELPDINVMSGSFEPLKCYPDDVYYNAACYGDTAIHNFKYTDKITLAVIEQKFSKRINVRQGYSKCSVCFVNSGAIITDDDGIAKKAANHNIDVLKISKGKVLLKGMDYGFFGGATGTYKDKIFLNGSLDTLDESKEIKMFLKKHDIELIELKSGAIEDVGSIICI